MASNTSICGICFLRQITRTSKHWCPECEEALCDECKEHHKLLKATRSHEPIPISSYKSLPSFITDIQQSCVYHNEQYQIYCNEHALPLCLQCINDHSNCNVTSLEKVTINVKTSGQFLDLESRLNDLLQNIDRMKKDRKANVTDIEKIKSLRVKEIQELRVEINKHLDNLEKQIIKDLEEKECRCKEKIRGVLSFVKEKETMINQCLANFQSIKKAYASDLQTFLGMREIEVKVNKHEQYLKSFIEVKSFEQLDLVCQVDTGVQSILDNVKSFGSTEIKARPNNFEFSRAKDKQAQLHVLGTRKTINDVKLILQKKITTQGNSVRGCCMLEGEFLITDHCAYNPLLVLESDGSLKYSMSLDPSKGFDITRVDENTVAITSGLSLITGIDIINIHNRSKVKFIKLPGHPFGITSDHDSLFVCVEGRGIYKVNTMDNSSCHVISCKLPYDSYVSVFNDKIYYTDNRDESVVCCDRNGSRVWTVKCDSVLKRTKGITVDNDGNVYVVGQGSSNVLIISNDGKHHKEIMSKEDGLCEPSAIFFDKQKRELLVTNLKTTAFLYNVT